MSRPLVCLAVLVGTVAGLLPIAAVLLRVDAADLGSLLEPRTLRLFARTCAYGIGVASLATVLGAPYGWLVARADLPAARWLRGLGLAPLCLPPLLLAMTWTAVVNARGAPAAWLVSTLHTWPLVALLTAHAATRIDRRIVEGARLAGGPWTALRIELPLLAPAVAVGACLAFVWTVNDFSVPDYVSWVGTRFHVYADEVFSAFRVHQGASEAVVAALPLIALTLTSLVPVLLLQRRGALASLRSDFQAPGRAGLGRARWPLALACGTLVALAAGLPIARLAWEAGGGTRGFQLGRLGASFLRAFELAGDDLGNSLAVAFGAASSTTALGLVLGHAVARARTGRLFEPLTLMPFAVPAVLFGIGAIVAWNRPGLEPLYDGAGMVLLLHTGRFLPLSILILASAVASLDPAGEESARLAGASPVRRLTAVVAPPLRGALAASWVLVFVFSLRELDASLLIPAASHTAVYRLFNALHFGRDDVVAALALILAALVLLPAVTWSFSTRPSTEVGP